MRMLRYIGVPRAMLDSELAEMPGWRVLGERMLRRAVALCPVSEDQEGGKARGPHLKDTLEVRFISGSDPRILIGSAKKGDVLSYVNDGTSAHEIVPVDAQALRFTDGGTVVFATHVDHPGNAANPFVMKAVREVLGAPG